MINQTLLLAGDDAYNLSKSLRFRKSANGLITRTFATNGTSRKTVTFSIWTKRGQLGTSQYLAGGYNGTSASSTNIIFNSSDQLNIDFGGSSTFSLITTQVFRDPSAWYHIVVVFDTTQATAANRVKLYVNGVQVTAFGTANYPAQNADGQFWNATSSNCIGSAQNYGGPYDGYMAEVNFIDGQALTPSSFGSFNALTGVWQPIKYSGTYGTNGFYLPFTDVALTSGSNAGVGKDFSGNANYWDTINISVTAGSTYDSMNDVPTLTSATQANYCVLNPDQPASVLGNLAYTKITNGNLNVELVAGSPTDLIAPATFSVTTGTYYYEFKLSATGSGNNYHSVGVYNGSQFTGQSQYLNSAIYYWERGSVRVNGTFVSTGLSTCVAGDIIGVALNCTTGAISFYKNNTLLYTASSLAYTIYTPLITGEGGGTFNGAINFGQQPFTYTPPTGFVALNTFNLPEPSIKQGNKHFDATVYTGNDTTNAIVNSGGFQPDMIWLKNRATGGYDHEVYDSIRGTGDKALVTNGTYAEAVDTGYINLVSFNSNGFTLGATTFTNVINKSGQSHVGWQWKANGTGSSNTAGSITSTVSANPTAGFSVVTYTGNNTLSTIGHGLGVSPKFIIVKTRSGNDNWVCYHGSLGVQYYTLLNTTASSYNNLSDYWSATAPSSSVFGINAYGGVNTNGATYVAYCWAEVAGYSKFTSYVGNGSSDGVFVYCGFKPKFVMFKRTDTSGADWFMYDSSRNTYNVANLYLAANTSSAEATFTTLDLLSNGFKFRTSDSAINSNGGTYIVAAFASNPFKNSLAA